MKTIPNSIIESARIDGAHEFQIFFRLVLPLSIPGLVTIGLFKALFFWNEWVQVRLYITTDKLYTLQYYLYNMITASQSYAELASEVGILFKQLPTESMKLATAVIATGPIVFLYPVASKYFIKGLTIGAIKG